MYPNVSAQGQWSLVIFCLSLSCSKWEGLINKAIAFWFRRDMSLIIIRSSRIVSWMQHRYSILQLFLGDCWLCLWCGWLWITSRTNSWDYQKHPHLRPKSVHFLSLLQAALCLYLPSFPSSRLEHWNLFFLPFLGIISSQISMSSNSVKKTSIDTHSFHLHSYCVQLLWQYAYMDSANRWRYQSISFLQDFGIFPWNFAV